MRTTKPIFGEEARQALKRGVDQVYESVAHTMGARGKNAVYKRYGAPVVTNDGVSIAREVIPADPYEWMGAELVKQAGEKQNEEAADGTTTVTVLAHAIIERGFAAMRKGANPMLLKRQLEEASTTATNMLKAVAVPVESLRDVANISVENQEIADLVSNVVENVGPKGIILVEESNGTEIEVDQVKGYWWDKGFVSPYMVTNDRGEAVLADCPVIITDRTLNLNADLLPVLQALLAKGHTSALIIGDNIEGELLQTLVANKVQQRFTAIAVKRPEGLEPLEDIATITNGVAVTKDKGIKTIGEDHIGRAQKVIVTKDRTIVVGFETEMLKDRIASVESQLEAIKDQKYGEAERLRERLGRLTGGLAVIRVGAKTEADRGYLKLKIDDAVGACRAAMEEGIVPGGGTTLRDVGLGLPEHNDGYRILADALTVPYCKILENAGMAEHAYDGFLRKTVSTRDYNVLSGELIEDMIGAGIVNPAKVDRCAIENAVSTAKTVLTCQCVIGELPREPQPSKPGQP